jgi:hypothetical protein
MYRNFLFCILLCIHRFNMELDLIYLGSCVQLFLLAETPQLPPLPLHLGSHTRALLDSQDRRHLWVKPLFASDPFQSS